MGTLVSICRSDDTVTLVQVKQDQQQQQQHREVVPNNTMASGQQKVAASGVELDSNEELDILDLNTMPAKEPMAFFQKWFEQAQYSEGIRLATSMTLATATKDGIPSCRIVGVKGFDKTGFKIATNSKSRKARELDENPRASLMFYWEPLNRMVRVDGSVTKLPEENATEIWKGFPKSAQLTHGASNQSSIITSREIVLDRKQELAAKHSDLAEVPKNPDWCAYNLAPEQWEFYQVSEDLPDRLVFRKLQPEESPDGLTLHAAHEGWVIERLSP